MHFTTTILPKIGQENISKSEILRLLREIQIIESLSTFLLINGLCFTKVRLFEQTKQICYTHIRGTGITDEDSLFLGGGELVNDLILDERKYEEFTPLLEL